VGVTAHSRSRDWRGCSEVVRSLLAPAPVDSVGGSVASTDDGLGSELIPRHSRRVALLRRRITASGQAGLMRRRPTRMSAPRSGFVGFRFPPDVIMLAVRWYLRYGLSYRDVEELLAERGIQVDHMTIYRLVQWFTPLT
jgi:hypothetical protein